MKDLFKTAALGAAVGIIGIGSAVLPMQAQGNASGELMSTVSSGWLNSNDAAGYLARGEWMASDANVRGALDQLKEAMREFPVSDDAEKAEIASALATMHIPGDDALNRLETFLQNHPASAWRERALLAVADVWYDRGEYALALKCYERVGSESLNSNLAEACRYRKAFCLLKLAEYERAGRIYDGLVNSSEFGNGAKFYQGYIAYVKQDYSKAAQLFKTVRPVGKPGNMAEFYLAQMSFMKGEYKDAAKSAQNLLQRQGIEPFFILEAKRMAGESLYHLGDEKQGIAYLKQYVASTDAPLNSSLYILGVDEYNHGRYQEATAQLTPVTNEDNSIGQSAYLYIGQAYLQQNNFNAAAMALEKSRQMSHDKEVQETAFYNLAVAKMQGGNEPFGSSVALFEEFLQTYPDSKFTPEVADYVIKGYMTDNNYPAAVAAINRMKHPSAAVLAAKQKVLYVLGSRELQAGNARSALSRFQEASSMSKYDADVAAESTLWAGECQYKLGNYAEAVKSYNSYLTQQRGSKVNKAIAYYDLGYARFALKNFADAKADFKKFLSTTPSNTNKQLLADAYNRLADSQYYTADFDGAATNYGKAYEVNPTAGDYPMYQQGVMKGLRRDYTGKIETLQEMMTHYPSSALIPSALLEMGESYGEAGSPERAIETYTTLVARYPSTAQGRQGQLLLAITYLNEGNRNQAIEHYKRVITMFPSSDEARVAADDLKQLYADSGRVNEYVSFINNVPDAPKPETAELSALTLLSAEKAIEAGRDDDALAHATEVVEKYPDSPQAIEALVIKADVEYKQGKGAEALASYSELERRASSATDVNAARMGILRVSRDLGEHQRTLDTANLLLESSALGGEGKREVAFTKGLALRDLGKADEAITVWQELAQDMDDIYGTKSSFNIAQYYADNKQDKEALEEVNKLIEANPPHDYWLARGFILLSDLLRRKGDTFEADEYLKSLKRNYPGTEADIFLMIDERLK